MSPNPRENTNAECKLNTPVVLESETASRWKGYSFKAPQPRLKYVQGCSVDLKNGRLARIAKMAQRSDNLPDVQLMYTIQRKKCECELST